MANLDSIPQLGAGLGYRPELHRDIIEHAEEIDFLEVIAERYAYGAMKALNMLADLSDQFAIIPHGVSLSIGTHQKVSRTHLDRIKRVIQLTKAPYFSEHLAVTQSPGIDIGHLSPICFTRPVLDKVISNIHFVQEILKVPLVLENITLTHEIPGSTMSQEEFFQEMCQRSGCGVLLDLTNLYTNSVNWGFDRFDRLSDFPLSHVVQVHLAGGIKSGDKLIDSHSEEVPSEVWELLGALLDRQKIKGAIVERDSNFPDFEHLLNEVRRIKSYFNSNLSRIA